MPRVCGLCGSSSVSHLAWCLRWIATHSLVTMPVVSHSQKRKKCDTTGCRSRARCAWVRCRKIVTAAIVMCVSDERARRRSPTTAVGTSPWATRARKSGVIDYPVENRRGFRGTTAGRTRGTQGLRLYATGRPSDGIAPICHDTARTRVARFGGCARCKRLPRVGKVGCRTSAALGTGAPSAHVALREGNPNAVGGESLQDRAVERAAADCPGCADRRSTRRAPA